MCSGSLCLLHLEHFDCSLLMVKLWLAENRWKQELLERGMALVETAAATFAPDAYLAGRNIVDTDNGAYSNLQSDQGRYPLHIL